MYLLLFFTVEILNYQKQENEGLSDQINQYEKNIERLEHENSDMLKIKDELIKGLDRVV